LNVQSFSHPGVEMARYRFKTTSDQSGHSFGITAIAIIKTDAQMPRRACFHQLRRVALAAGCIVPK
jgi:hypothetical protein